MLEEVVSFECLSWACQFLASWVIAVYDFSILLTGETLLNCSSPRRLPWSFQFAGGVSKLGFGAYAVLSFAFILFADFLPFRVGQYDSQRFFLVFSLAAIPSVALVFLIRLNRFLPSLMVVGPFFFFPSYFVIVAFAEFGRQFSMVEPLFFALYFLVFPLAGTAIAYAGSAISIIKVFLSVALLACFFYAAMTVTLYVFVVSDGSSKIDEFIPWGFVNIRYWSHIATWLLPLFPLALLAHTPKYARLWRAAIYVTASIWWWVILLSMARGTIIGIAIGVCVSIVIFRRASFDWLKSFALLSVLGFFVWILLSFLLPSIFLQDVNVRELKVGSSGRMPMWVESWLMSLDNFPFGMGPQSWLTHRIITDDYRFSSKFAHPHNMYLLWAAEYGWICLVGFLLGCITVLKRLITAKRDANELSGCHVNSLVAFTVSSVAAFVHAGASAVFIAPASMIVGMFVLTLFWALLHNDLANSNHSSSAKNSVIETLVAYVCVVVFAFGSLGWLFPVMRYYGEMTRDVEFYRTSISEGQQPRFWLHGNFPRPESSLPLAPN